MEKYLGRYSGLILYLKEMDEVSYAKLCAVLIYLVRLRAILIIVTIFRHTSRLRVSFIAHR
jgi:hypothetical protein